MEKGRSESLLPVLRKKVWALLMEENADIMWLYLFLPERLDFFVVFTEFVHECRDLLLEVVFGTLATVRQSVLVHLEHCVEAVRPVKQRAVQLYVIHCVLTQNTYVSVHI